MTPRYDGSWRGVCAIITTRDNDLGNKVVADVELKEGKDSGLSAVFGLIENLKSESEILELLAEDGVEVGRQTSEYPIIDIS